jgi:glycosyltransferase involved in cell wall biosynthesis
VPAVERAGLDWPLVVAGDGPERAAIEASAERSSHDIRMLGWIDRDRTTAWMAHASMLIFPSRGPESLSRVLLEAAALGLPIAAMNTGGTPDIVIDGQTGLLSHSADDLSADIKRLRADADLRGHVGHGAMVHAESHFDAPAVVARMEQLYVQLIEERAR